MNSKKRLSAGDRKQAILAASMDVFANKGFSAATSKDLAAAAGVSEALLYKHFPTKEAMYNELISFLGSRKDESLAKMMSMEPSGEAFITSLTFLGRIILLGTPDRPNDGRVDRLMAQSMLGDGAFVRAFLDNMFKPVLPYMLKCLEVSWEQGDLQVPRKPEELHCYLAHHFFGAMTLFRLPSPSLFNETDPEHTLKEMLLFAFRALGFRQTALDRYFDFERLNRSFQLAMQQENTL